MDNEGLDLVIGHMEKDLKELKARKRRSDNGIKRTKYKSDLPPKYREYMNRANKKQLSFTLSVQEFQSICMHACVYCGNTSRIGVDRKDSSDGYTLENSQPCCTMCNMMKWTQSEEDFLRQVLRISKHRSI